MNLIQHRTDLTEIGLGFTGYFPFPDFWSLGSGISVYSKLARNDSKTHTRKKGKID